MKLRTILLFFITLLFCTNVLRAGDCTGYEINLNNTPVDKEEFINVFKKFDYEKFRTKYLDYVMHFNNGIEVILFAADKAKIYGCDIQEKRDYPALEYLQENISYFQYNSKQGTIMATYKIKTQK